MDSDTFTTLVYTLQVTVVTCLIFIGGERLFGWLELRCSDTHSRSFILSVALGCSAHDTLTAEAPSQAIQANVHMGRAVPAALITYIGGVSDLNHHFDITPFGSSGSRKMEELGWAVLDVDHGRAI